MYLNNIWNIIRINLSMNLKMFKESFFYDDTNQLWNTNKLSLDNYNPFLEDEMYILKNNCLKKQKMSIFGNSLIRFCKVISLFLFFKDKGKMDVNRELFFGIS